MRLIGVMVCLGLALSVLGCTATKADEAPDSGYLDDTGKMKEDRDRFPFNKVWLKDYTEKYYHDNFTEIMVAPVNTDHLLKMDWTDNLSLAGKDTVKKDVKTIAKYMYDQFVKELKDDEKSPFKLVDKAGPKTMILELALVELVPTKAWMNAAGTAAGIFVPGASTAAGLAASGSVAVEGRVRDGRTGEIIAMFKDREKDQSSPIGIQGFTWYYHSENNIDDWAEQFAEILDTKATDEVADSAPFTLRMW